MAMRQWILIGLNFAVLLGLPGLWRWLGEREGLTYWALYGGWWLVGALVGLQALNRAGVASHQGKQPGLGRVFIAAVAIVPVVSIIVHLAIAHYVYARTFYFFECMPLVLGTTVCCFCRLQKELDVVVRRKMIIVMGVVVVLGSIIVPSHFLVSQSWISVSPLRIMLVAVSMLYAVAWWRCGGWGLLVSGVLASCTALLGHTLEAMGHVLGWVWEVLGDGVKLITPNSAIQWGVITVISAFVMLGIGVAASLLKRPTKPDGE